jgi:hypothetical protein
MYQVDADGASEISELSNLYENLRKIEREISKIDQNKGSGYSYGISIGSRYNNLQINVA